MKAPAVPKAEDDGTREPTASEQVFCKDIQIPRSSTRLEALINKQEDANCKFELWATLARRRTNLEADSGAAAGPNYHQRSAAVEERRKTTLAEIDAEVAFLRREGAQPKQADVSRLILRKAIEFKYRVKLTAIGGQRPNGSNIAWTEEELRQIEKGLAAVPLEMVRGNPRLATIERADRNPDHPEYRAGYDPEGKRIVLYDRNPLAPRNATEGASLVGWTAITAVEATDDFSDHVVHELGHIFERQFPSLYQRFVKLAGWQSQVSDEQLRKNAQFSPSLIESLHNESNVWAIGADGLRYEPRRERGEAIAHNIIARNAEAVPNSATWNRARESAAEFWAELISKAVLRPAQVVRDMIDQPTEELALAVRSHQTSRVVAQAREKQHLLREEFEIIRTLFQSDAAARELAAQLRVEGIPPTTVAQFLVSARRLATPSQIGALASWILTSAAGRSNHRAARNAYSHPSEPLQRAH